jgi:hypothetical protein
VHCEPKIHAETRESGVSDKKRKVLELRTIRVSTKAALRAVSSDEEAKRIKTMSTELLARLESAVIRDGANPELIAALEDARRELGE